MSATTNMPARAPMLLLFPAAAVAGFGLGLLVLTATAPAPQIAPLPPPEAIAQPDDLAADLATDLATALADPRGTASTAWPALFGRPAPAPVAAPPPPPAPEPMPEPEPEFEEVPFLDTDQFVLRGLVYAEDGGWALLDVDGEVFIVRRGDTLLDGEEITAIAPDGIVLTSFGEDYFIGFDTEVDDFDDFDDFDDDGPGPRPARPSRRNSTRSGELPGFGLGRVGGDAGR